MAPITGLTSSMRDDGTLNEVPCIDPGCHHRACREARRQPPVYRREREERGDVPMPTHNRASRRRAGWRTRASASWWKRADR